MKILITGTTGYIAKRLALQLLEDKHELICCVRDLNRIPDEIKNHPSVTFIKVDFLDTDNFELPKEIDIAYYLIHSMSTSSGDFETMEEKCAKNFKKLIGSTNCKQVIYLSGIVNNNELSKHLKSRLQVENTLQSDAYALTTFRAGIIVGSGSASFEIIRDIVEKLPVMITPKWLNTKCQPIGIRDVLTLLEKSLMNEKVYDQNFDIGGPDILNYKEMLLHFAKFRKLKRRIYTIPIMTPKLSSYWLYFVTSTSYNLASSLVSSMKIEVVCRDTKINEILDVKPETYKKALERAFAKIDSNQIVSSWKDSQVSGVMEFNITDFVDVPTFGCFTDIRQKEITSTEDAIAKIWGIGGTNGWYYANFLWKIRGYMDKLVGGVGLRRGRTSPTSLSSGDALDFWRVLYANKSEGRLLLFAEMKLPGEAWLEFKIVNNKVVQTATFRPQGILGRLYWYSVLPFHGLIFKGMLNEITEQS